jgi:F-type H+-transporting ATPase subunit b
MQVSIPCLALASEGGGFDPLDLANGGNTLWTWIIFLVAMPFVWKVVMGPVTRALVARDERAESAIAAAEKARAESEAASQNVQAALAQAQAGAQELLGQARARGAVREKEIVEAARAEAVQLVEAARKAIRAEQDKALGAIKAQVVELALHAATKVLERNVSSEDDRRLVASLVAQSQVARN